MLLIKKSEKLFLEIGLAALFDVILAFLVAFAKIQPRAVT